MNAKTKGYKDSTDDLKTFARFNTRETADVKGFAMLVNVHKKTGSVYRTIAKSEKDLQLTLEHHAIKPDVSLIEIIDLRGAEIIKYAR